MYIVIIGLEKCFSYKLGTWDLYVGIVAGDTLIIRHFFLFYSGKKSLFLLRGLGLVESSKSLCYVL